mmetsp:Transcript_23235/g.62982  ORF Transcript_23235/g.62982 Transcript_23235/m.62982 type:complete len:299 (-) Transcript_23235:70-966(-)
MDLAQERALRIEDLDAVARGHIHIPKVVKLEAIRDAWRDVGEEASVCKSAACTLALDVKLVDAVGPRGVKVSVHGSRVHDVHALLIKAERKTIGLVQPRVHHGKFALLGVITIHVPREDALLVRELDAAVRRVGEPHGAVRFDHHVVWRIEGFASVVVHDGLARAEAAVLIDTDHAHTPTSCLARDDAEASEVDRLTVGVVRVAEHWARVAVRAVPDDVRVVPVARGRAVARGEAQCAHLPHPCRALSPRVLEPRDTGELSTWVHEVLEALVNNFDGVPIIQDLAHAIEGGEGAESKS